MICTKNKNKAGKQNGIGILYKQRPEKSDEPCKFLAKYYKWRE